MEAPKAPQIENLQKITPEQAAEYVRFVAQMRHQQSRWFRLRNFDALKIAQEMEKELDKLNAYLLDPTPKLFWYGILSKKKRAGFIPVCPDKKGL